MNSCVLHVVCSLLVQGLYALCGVYFCKAFSMASHEYSWLCTHMYNIRSWTINTLTG